MQPDYDYYQDQIDKVKTSSKYFKTVKIQSIKGQTNNLDINLESIPALIRFLEEERKRLLK